jgi:hypothetical protein
MTKKIGKIYFYLTMVLSTSCQHPSSPMLGMLFEEEILIILNEAL